MIELVDTAITQRRHKSDVLIDVDFASIGARLTADGEVAVIGFVHHYLSRWCARAAEGNAPRPAIWPQVVYEYVPEHLTMPVIRSEAREVSQALRSILVQPNILKRQIP